MRFSEKNGHADKIINKTVSVNKLLKHGGFMISLSIYGVIRISLSAGELQLFLTSE